MNSKKFAMLAVVAFVGGIVGGIVSDRAGSISQVFATGSNCQCIKTPYLSWMEKAALCGRHQKGDKI